MPVFHLTTARQLHEVFPLEPELAHHLITVLRKARGESFEVFLPNGDRATARLLDAVPPYRAEILQLSKGENQLSELELCVALIQWPRLEWLVEKATELGLKRLRLIQFEQGRYSSKAQHSPQKINRLRRIASETLKQCERPFAPEILEPVSFQDFLAQASTDEEVGKIFAWERSDSPGFGKWLTETSPKTYQCLIGPEGGFRESEVTQLQQSNFHPASLGKHPLRSETAALYCLSLLHHHQSFPKP